MRGTCGAVLNAANEAAVARFLAGELAFLDVPLAGRPGESSLQPELTLAELAACDRRARQEVGRWNSSLRHPSARTT